MPTTAAHREREAEQGPVQIRLDSDEVVLRGFGNDLEPAVLSGDVVLNLTESTNLKEVTLVFAGKSRTLSHGNLHDAPLFFHDQVFLRHGTSSSPAYHTLKAGRHVFPFSLHLPGSLPATLRTHTSTGSIQYRLKAVVVRSGIMLHDWTVKKEVTVTRAYSPDAAEYNQTMEIENKWPGKIEYAFTVPHKAWAAGDNVLVNIKLQPLAKGVRVKSLLTTVKQHCIIYGKGATRTEEREVVCYRRKLEPGHRRSVQSASMPNVRQRTDSSSSTASVLAGPSSTAGSSTLASLASINNAVVETASELTNEEDLLRGDESTDITIEVPLPEWLTPTHTTQPVMVSYKIKWSAFIKNADGHVSELRCALPLHILSHTLLTESRLASAGVRSMLFGPSGVLVNGDETPVDLPSYGEHVRDRIANAHLHDYWTAPTPRFERQLGSWTPATSPAASRPGTPDIHGMPGGSRHRDLPQGFSSLSTFSDNIVTPPMDLAMPPSTDISNRPWRLTSTETGTSSASPISSSFSNSSVPLANWADPELLSSLSLANGRTPNGHAYHDETSAYDAHASPFYYGSGGGSTSSSRSASRPASRQGQAVSSSRPSSRPGSRPSSRPPSPVQGSSSIAFPSTRDNEHPLQKTKNTSSSGFLSHIHLPKPLRSLTPLTKSGHNTPLHGSHSSQNTTPPSASAPGAAPHPAAVASALNAATLSNVSSQSSSPQGLSPTHSTQPIPSRLIPGATPPNGAASQVANLDDSEALSRVPSYEVAAQGFLGGGVVPLSSQAGLPSYDEVEDQDRQQSQRTTPSVSPQPGPTLSLGPGGRPAPILQRSSDPGPSH